MLVAGVLGVFKLVGKSLNIPFPLYMGSLSCNWASVDISTHCQFSDLTHLLDHFCCIGGKFSNGVTAGFEDTLSIGKVNGQLKAMFAK